MSTMNNPSPGPPQWGKVAFAYRCDRWSAYYRLQELDIPCACAKDGTLEVEVNHAQALVLARSAIRQLTSTRQEDLDWLERCWETQEVCCSAISKKTGFSNL
jgi:hypothetical protein